MDRHLPSGLRPKKRLGQNFLCNKGVVDGLVAAAEVSSSDTVIEVGAGTGALTKELAKKVQKVIAFEIDRDLIPVLEKSLWGFDNVEIINEDILKSDNYIALCSDIQLSQFKIVGSIPYQITSPLIHRLLDLEPEPSLVVLLIQKEVAEKITARPPKATYLSNIVNLLGEVEIVRFVPKTAFWPVPKVDGAVIKLKMQNAKCKIRNADDFQKFLHRGFEHPRKMLRNKFETQLLKNASIDPTHRAQRLSLEDWINLWRLYSKTK